MEHGIERKTDMEEPPQHTFLKTLVEAFQNDIPKGDYSKLNLKAVQMARRDLDTLLEATPGANYQNVKILRAQISLAEMGKWSELRAGSLEDAISEYTVLMKCFREAQEKKRQDVYLSNNVYGQPEGQKTEERSHSETKHAIEHRTIENQEKPTGLKKVDTAESLLRKRDEQNENKLDNEEVPMPTLKKVDTAELLRRSQEAGRQLHVGNASITDLSDSKRPTKLAEMFTELYDNEWTDALEELLTIERLSEEDAINILLRYIQGAFIQCKEEAEERKSVMKNGFLKSRQMNGMNEGQIEFEVQEKMKKVTDAEMDDIKNRIGDKVGMENKSQIVRCYIDECVRLSYLMNVQNPPMVLCTPKTEEFRPEYYKEYTRSGTKVKYVVWPALLLEEGGPLLTKGVVQLE